MGRSVPRGQRSLFEQRLAASPQQDPDGQEPTVWTVSELTRQIKLLLEEGFPEVWVSGEVSNLRRSQAGHLYFTLKDAEAQLNAVVWQSTARRMRFELENGLEVVCQGSVEVYAPRGSYQLIVRQVQPRGLGALELAFRQLYQRLQRQGLFDPRHKQPLPRFPRYVAVITSPAGAAIRDILKTLRHRWPLLRVLVVPAAVQGEEAPGQIARAVELVHRLRPRPDVLIVGRGGGSLEDLWAFNTEEVVRALFESQVPVVSAVGHEVDTTLADLVADLRALTPTDAGQKVVPHRREILQQLHHLAQRLRRHVQQQVVRAAQRLEAIRRSRVLRRPQVLLDEPLQRVDELAERLARALQRQLEQARGRVNQAAAKLETLSPVAVLARGYSVTLRAEDGQVLRSFDQVAPGDRLLTQLARGTVTSRVESTSAQEHLRPPGDSGPRCE